MGSFQTKAESAPRAHPQPLADNENDNEREGQSRYFADYPAEDLKGYWFQSDNESRLKLFERIGGAIDIDPRHSIQFCVEIMEKTCIQSALIINLLGGLMKINSLPILDLGSQIHPQSQCGNLLYLVASDLSAPMMRGIDFHGRPFLAFQFPFQGQNRVASLLQVDIKAPLNWVLGGPDSDWLGPCLQPLELDSIAYKHLQKLILSHNKA